MLCGRGRRYFMDWKTGGLAGNRISRYGFRREAGDTGPSGQPYAPRHFGGLCR